MTTNFTHLARFDQGSLKGCYNGSGTTINANLLLVFDTSTGMTNGVPAVKVPANSDKIGRAHV